MKCLKVALMVMMLAGAPVGVGAEESLETMQACMSRLGEFLNLQEGQELRLSGANENGACELEMKRVKYVNGINKQDTRLLDLFVNAESGSGKMMKGVWTRIEDQQLLSSATLAECSVEGNTAKLDVTLRETAGWRKTFRNTVTLEKTDGKLTRIFSTEKELRFLDFSAPFTEECRF